MDRGHEPTAVVKPKSTASANASPQAGRCARPVRLSLAERELQELVSFGHGALEAMTWNGVNVDVSHTCPVDYICTRRWETAKVVPRSHAEFVQPNDPAQRPANAGGAEDP
jgi:hypothetical protein